MKTWIAFSVLIVLMGAQAAAQAPLEGAYVAWSPDGQYIAVRYEGEVIIVDAQALEVLNVLDGFRGQSGHSDDLEWRGDSQRLAAINGPDVEVWQAPWDPVNASLVTTYRYYDAPEQSSLFVRAIAWNPDGTLITATHGYHVDIWNAETGIQTANFPGNWGNIWSADWSVDNRIAITDTQGNILILDPSTGNILSYLLITYANSPTLLASAFNSEGSKLVMSWETNGVVFNEMPSGMLQPDLYLSGHDDIIASVAWNHSSTAIATGSGNGRVIVFDAVSGEPLEVIDTGNDLLSINSVAFSPDGTRLAYGVLDDMPVIIPAPVIEPQPTVTPTP